MHPEDLEKIFSYIDEHIYEKITLMELADIAGYSPFYFSKLFSEAIGMPVTGYIRIRKMQYALSSLLEGKKILDVSLMYAFDSHEGFTRSFSQMFGSTPSTVRKYLKSYRVPEYRVPDIKARRVSMGLEHHTLLENMHQIVFEVLWTSFEEAEEGYCTEINITVFSDGKIKISDNGRGIPLSKDIHLSQKVLDKILSGHPISNLEYAQMGDFSQCGMQTVNSLCESLQVHVYRDGNWFRQEYVRGIAQHEVICTELEHAPGTEMILKPDSVIFGDLKFDIGMIKDWVAENINKNNMPLVNFESV